MDYCNLFFFIWGAILEDTAEFTDDDDPVFNNSFLKLDTDDCDHGADSSDIAFEHSIYEAEFGDIPIDEFRKQLVEKTSRGKKILDLKTEFDLNDKKT